MNCQPVRGSLVVLACAVLIGLVWPGSIRSQEKAPADGSIRVGLYGGTEDYAAVTLFREGKAIATNDVAIPSPFQNRIIVIVNICDIWSCTQSHEVGCWK
jgi:hypothetical protein